ncbi:hypothetical protein [Hymenobacter cellulosilyticus]|uniref:hypothetical protein n=1 Tax=Hymenobacter cellulosilyticus TaxID=2932248 RepID=UPI0021D3F8AF|nr:hypothetical protein [Hymenobacter cellulosilyticus]
MPESALSNVDIDYVVPLKEMGFLLTRLTRMPLASVQNIPEDIKLEAAIAERVVGTIDEVTRLARPVPMTCPDCGGSLFELKHGKLLRYRCHTGHAFTADMLLQRTQHGLEESLWVALRMLEERKNLLTNMASRSEGPYGVQQEERIEEMKMHINRLREFLLNGTPKHSGSSNGTSGPDHPADTNGLATRAPSQCRLSQ